MVAINQINCITSIINGLKWLAIAIIIALVIYGMIKSDKIRSIVMLAIVIVIGFSGVASATNVIEYYTRTGATVGEISSSIFNSNIANVERKDAYIFEYKQIGFASTGESNQYQSKISEPRTVDIDLTQSWEIFINDIECNNCTVKGNEITADFINAFYNKNGELILEDKLQIQIVFHKITFEIYLTTNGGDSAVKYWNTYLEKNNFEITIKKCEKQENAGLIIDKVADMLELTLEDGSIINLNCSSELNFEELLYLNGLAFTTIKKVVIPEGVVYISHFNSINNKKLIKEIVLPNSLRKIANNCFYGQTLLTEIIIPENVTFPPISSAISSNKAFDDCTNLKKVTFLNPNIEIPKYLFEGCYNLTEIYFNGTLEQWSNKNITIGYLNDYNLKQDVINIYCNDGTTILTKIS